MSENWAFVLTRPELSFADETLATAVRGRRVLITGAGGSIGSHLARRIVGLEPERLLLLDAHEASLWRLRQSLEGTGDAASVDYVLADVRDRPKLRATLRRAPCEVIFHLAAYKHVALAEENVDQAVAVNLVGTLNLVETAAETGADTIILPTTDKTVNPSSLYGCTKRAVERLVRSAPSGIDGLSLRVARLVNVLGTQGSVVEVFARQIRAGKAISVTDLATDRYYITMDEAVGFLLGVAVQSEAAGVFLVETGDPIRTIDLARRIHREENREGDGRRIEGSVVAQGGPTDHLVPPLTPRSSVHLPLDSPGDLEVRITGLKPGERLHEELTWSYEQRRSTDLDGIWSLDAPAEAAPVDEWLDELRRLRRDLYEWEPADLRAYLFELARAASPAHARRLVAGGE